MFGAAGPLRRSKTQRLLMLSESRLVALRQIKAAGSGEGMMDQDSRSTLTAVAEEMLSHRLYRLDWIPHVGLRLPRFC